MLEELLPIVVKLLIHYAAREAISAVIDTLIFVTGRNKPLLKTILIIPKNLLILLRAEMLRWMVL